MAVLVIEDGDVRTPILILEPIHCVGYRLCSG